MKSSPHILVSFEISIHLKWQKNGESIIEIEIYFDGTELTFNLLINLHRGVVSKF